jgi:hypothetical protein
LVVFFVLPPDAVLATRVPVAFVPVAARFVAGAFLAVDDVRREAGRIGSRQMCSRFGGRWSRPLSPVTAESESA